MTAKIAQPAKPLLLIRPVPVLGQLALGVREISVDFIEVENRTLRSRWFHSDDELDLFVWVDEKGRLFKAQANVMGQVLEWNVLNGVRTGVAVEEERKLGDDEEMTLREQIVFDKKTRPETQRVVLEFVNSLVCIENPLKDDLDQAFRGESALSFMRFFVGKNPAVKNPADKDPFEIALDHVRAALAGWVQAALKLLRRTFGR